MGVGSTIYACLLAGILAVMLNRGPDWFAIFFGVAVVVTILYRRTKHRRGRDTTTAARSQDTKK